MSLCIVAGCQECFLVVRNGKHAPSLKNIHDPLHKALQLVSLNNAIKFADNGHGIPQR